MMPDRLPPWAKRCLLAEPVPAGWQGCLCCVLGLSLACDSKPVIGTWSCPSPAHSSDISGSAGQANDGPKVEFPIPWSTGFEDAFCDFFRVGGNCYDNPQDSAWHVLVDTPVRSGRHAAAFTVIAGRDTHTRCILEGKLPEHAYYGAWYWVPAVHTVLESEIWNLIHFQVHRQSHRSPGTFETLWDVLLENDEAGGLRMALKGNPVDGRYWAVPGENPSIPIGKWFQVEVYLKLASDETGEIALYLNGTRYLWASRLKTDFDDSVWGQFYVGNLAYALDPPQSTVYVDDVSVSLTR